MEWVTLVLGLLNKTGDIVLINMARKYKEQLKEIENKLWIEENKELSVRDMARIDNYKREKEQLERIFYDELHKATVVK